MPSEKGKSYILYLYAWEENGGYPDMETIPAVANYFHISIDELFGYNYDREERINDILTRADKVLKKQRRIIVERVLEDVGEIIDMLRTAIEEFPSEPRILLKLAQALNLFGYNKYGARGQLTDPDGVILEDVEYNKQNVYWQESIRYYERTLASNPSSEERKTAIFQLTPLYCRMGEFEKAKALANEQAELDICKEMLLPFAAVGDEKTVYESSRITALLSNLRFSIYSFIAIRPAVSQSDYKKQILLSLLNLYETIFIDGRCGIWHQELGQMYIDLSSHEAKYGEIQNALAYFDKGFCHYKEYERVLKESEYSYSAPLVCKTKSVIDNTLVTVNDDFWKHEMPSFPESFRDELRKNSKYAECFE